ALRVRAALSKRDFVECERLNNIEREPAFTNDGHDILDDVVIDVADDDGRILATIDDAAIDQIANNARIGRHRIRVIDRDAVKPLSAAKRVVAVSVAWRSRGDSGSRI